MYSEKKIDKYNLLASKLLFNNSVVLVNLHVVNRQILYRQNISRNHNLISNGSFSWEIHQNNSFNRENRSHTICKLDGFTQPSQVPASLHRCDDVVIGNTNTDVQANVLICWSASRPFNFFGPKLQQVNIVSRWETNLD